MNVKLNSDQTLDQWRNKEILAAKLNRVVGDLRFTRSIDLQLFRYDLYDARPSKLIQLHTKSEDYSNIPLPIETSLEIANQIVKLRSLPPCKIDIGKLGLEWQQDKLNMTSIASFVSDKLSFMIGATPKNKGPRDVILYGFGRIGRLAARRIISETGRGEQLRLMAIVLRPKLTDRYEEVVKRAALLEADSVHGDFSGTIEVSPGGEELIINGSRVNIIFAQQPEDIDYKAYGIDNAVLIDNTGVWRDKKGLSRHLRPGVASVLLTAPGKGEVPNVVYGVNHEHLDFDVDRIFSAASCTTNAIVPVLKIVNDAYGVKIGHIETIHSYTNDQNLLDNFHKKPRRGRGAPINLVLTSTGAATAVSKVIPDLAGKLSGNAVRVPTPDVSIAILNLTLEKATSTEELNALLQSAALSGDLVEQVRYSNSTEYVSSNAIGMTGTSVVDAPSTIVSDEGLNVVLYLWYDNEYGYTCQVVRLAKHAAKVRRYVYY